MRHLALALLLACMISGVAWAGEIPTSDRTTPPGSSSRETPCEIPCGDRSGEVPTGEAPAPPASTVLLEIMLTLITIGR